MPVVRKTLQARQDLREIWRYLDREASEGIANRELRWIQKVADRLAAMPQAAPARPELGPDIRFRPIGSYNLYFRPTADGIQIVRVLHGARDIRPEMFE